MEEETQQLQTIGIRYDKKHIQNLDSLVYYQQICHQNSCIQKQQYSLQELEYLQSQENQQIQNYLQYQNHKDKSLQQYQQQQSDITSQSEDDDTATNQLNLPQFYINECTNSSDSSKHIYFQDTEIINQSQENASQQLRDIIGIKLNNQTNKNEVINKKPQAIAILTISPPKFINIETNYRVFNDIFLSEFQIKQLFSDDPTAIKQNYLSVNEPTNAFKKIMNTVYDHKLNFISFDLFNTDNNNSPPIEYIIQRLESYNNQYCFELARMFKNYQMEEQKRWDEFEQLKQNIQFLSFRETEEFKLKSLEQQDNTSTLCMVSYSINEYSGQSQLNSLYIGVDFLKHIGYDPEELQFTLIKYGFPNVKPKIDFIDRIGQEISARENMLLLLKQQIHSLEFTQNGGQHIYYKKDGSQIKLNTEIKLKKLGNQFLFFIKSTVPFDEIVQQQINISDLQNPIQYVRKQLQKEQLHAASDFD